MVARSHCASGRDDPACGVGCGEPTEQGGQASTCELPDPSPTESTMLAWRELERLAEQQSDGPTAWSLANARRIPLQSSRHRLRRFYGTMSTVSSHSRISI